MEFVLGILVACVLAGVGWPQVVRNRQHYLIAVGCLAAALVLTALASLLGGHAGGRFLLFLAYIADLATFVFLLCAAGGLSLAQLARDVRTAFANFTNLWK
ncbi:MAG: hypothetical protein JWL69_4662 [Phycisphaerales bacterium]|nr:hypothetical protein [Phycisphaerales bacterium]